MAKNNNSNRGQFRSVRIVNSKVDRVLSARIANETPSYITFWDSNSREYVKAARSSVHFL